MNFKLQHREKDAHSRIIWGLNWCVDDALFATASRENKKSVKVWHGKGENMCKFHSEISVEKYPNF